MVTLVGTEVRIEDAIAGLIELEHNVIGAYRFAFEKLSNIVCKNKLHEFLIEHEQWIEKIRQSYNVDNVELPEEGNLMKSAITKLKIILSNVKGEEVRILKTILENVTDATIAFERVLNHPQLPKSLNALLWQAFESEKKAKAWLEDSIVKAR